MANEFIARNGIFALNNSQITGSLAVSAGITGTLTGTATQVSNALTIGTGLSGTSYNGSSAVTIANTGVTSAVAGTDITVSGATGAVTIATNSTLATVTGRGATTSTNISLGGGNTSLNNGTSNRISWANFGINAPTFTSYSTGTKLVLYDSIGAADAGYTIGIDNNTFWCTVPAANATANYKWYGGTTIAATLTGAGAFTATADVTAFSDARLKENVNTITGALDKVARLRGVTYNRIDLEDKSERLGFIAQEVKEVIPQVVLGTEEETYSVAYGNITALHNEAIKELKAEIEELKGIISTLINK